MRRLLIQIAIGITGIWLANQFINGVEFRGSLQELLVAGTILGLVNFLLKPIVNLLTFPLRLITLGLFGFAANMFMIWIVDILLPNFDVVGIIPLFWMTLLIWALGFVVPILIPKKRPKPIPTLSHS